MSQIQKPLPQPIITGRPNTTPKPAGTKGSQQPPGVPFKELLEQRIQGQRGQELTLSKHAQARTAQRGIALDQSSMDRLGEAVEQAESKGLTDTLVFMDNTAYIVNVPNRVVVTVVGASTGESTVFTNIDGAVIV